MDINPPPGSNPDSNDNDGSAKKVHRPEFIILEKEDAEPKGSASSEQSEYYDSFRKLNSIHFSLFFHFIMLLGLLLASLALVFVSLLSLINLLFGAITLFGNKDLNQYLAQSWRNIKKLIVCLVGFLIGIFSPSMGIGFIVLYFMSIGEKLNKSYMSRVFQDPGAS